MASGGIVGYKNKGKTEYKEAADDYGKQLQEIFEKEGRYKKRYSDYEKGERFTYPLTPRDYVVSDEEYSRLKEGDYVMGEGALQEYRPFLMLLNALDGESGAKYMPESEVKGLKAKLKASIMEDKLSQMGMASGGRTGYQVGGFTPTAENPYPTGSELVSDTFTPTGTIEERALIAAGINPQGMKSEDIKNTYNLLKQDYREKNPGLGDKAFEFMYGEEFGDEFMDYVSSVPIGGLAVKGLQKGLPMIPKAYKGLKNYFKKAKTKETKLPDVKVKGGGNAPGGVMIETLEQAGPGRKFIQPIINNPIKSSLVATPILGGINQLTGEPEIEPNINNEDTTKSTEQLEIDRLNALLAEMRNKDSETVDTSKDRRNADMLIGLGGAIGSAKNLGELSSNISDAYFGVQSKRDAKDLAGLQGRLIEAQTAKYEADISGLSVGRLEFLITNLSKQIEEGAFASDEERNTAIKQRDDLIKAYAAATGFASLDAKNQRNKNLGLEGLITEVG